MQVNPCISLSSWIVNLGTHISFVAVFFGFKTGTFHSSSSLTNSTSEEEIGLQQTIKTKFL
jgi:hypothetical protein